MKEKKENSITLTYNRENHNKALQICEMLKTNEGVDVTPEESRFFWSLLDRVHLYYSKREKKKEQLEITRKELKEWGL